MKNAVDQVKKADTIVVKNLTKNTQFSVKVTLSDRQVHMILAGGLLNYTKVNNR